jgi:hypothetical protein
MVADRQGRRHQSGMKRPVAPAGSANPEMRRQIEICGRHDIIQMAEHQPDVTAAR